MVPNKLIELLDRLSGSSSTGAPIVIGGIRSRGTVDVVVVDIVIDDVAGDDDFFSFLLFLSFLCFLCFFFTTSLLTCSLLG